MNPKDHSRKTVEKHVEKARQEHFRCDNCGETFVSEAAREAHRRKAHAGFDKNPKSRHA